MTEEEWRTCERPPFMLDFLVTRVFSERKWRLFACACCRADSFLGELNRVYPPVPMIDSFLSVAEWFADGVATRQELDAALVAVPRGDRNQYSYGGRPLSLQSRGQGLRTVRALAAESGIEAALEVIREGSNLLGDAPCELLREHFGPLPFREVRLGERLRVWEGGVIPGLALAAYEERDFGRLGVLADALEDAGCDETELKEHLRREGGHGRGCWALDVILGRA